MGHQSSTSALVWNMQCARLLRVADHGRGLTRRRLDRAAGVMLTERRETLVREDYDDETDCVESVT
ncbi:hypothetical protein C5O80_37605 [Burkholderia sp. SRS-46]|nr:hypothetical protein C5O80_37605 [Burkholderia sp. SRS-46]